MSQPAPRAKPHALLYVFVGVCVLALSWLSSDSVGECLLLILLYTVYITALIALIEWKTHHAIKALATSVGFGLFVFIGQWSEGMSPAVSALYGLLGLVATHVVYFSHRGKMALLARSPGSPKAGVAWLAGLLVLIRNATLLGFVFALKPRTVLEPARLELYLIGVLGASLLGALIEFALERRTRMEAQEKPEVKAREEA